TFVRTDQETDAQKPLGHGLYTFAFVANLLSQLPPGTNISSLLQNAHAPAGSPDCRLNFQTAAEVAGGEIARQRDALHLQEPEHYFAQPRIAPLACSVAREVAP